MRLANPVLNVPDGEGVGFQNDALMKRIGQDFVKFLTGTILDGKASRGGFYGFNALGFGEQEKSSRLPLSRAQAFQDRNSPCNPLCHETSLPDGTQFVSFHKFITS